MNEYTPPKVWSTGEDDNGKFSAINQPTSGKRFDRELPRGQHDLQLYSLATPNGVKVTLLLEELVELGIKEAEYDAYTINIMEQDQFGSGFVDINPNSKIPALVDYSHGKKIRVFESGSILLYLAKKFKSFLPEDLEEQTKVMNWLFWQMGSAPYIGGGFGHFYAYAPEKIKYAIDRFSMEAKRQLDLLNKHLENRKFMIGDEYTIADMAIWPWYGALVRGDIYSASEFLQTDEYSHILRWDNEIAQRPAAKRATRVNKTWGEESLQVRERHSMADFKS